MNDNRKFSDLTVDEGIELLKDIPKSYFVEACRAEWRIDLDAGIDKKVSDYTGRDVSTPDGKKHVQRVYNSAESHMEKSNLVGRTFIIEAVKVLVGVVMILIALKLTGA